ncbi:replication initiation protein RepM [Psychrobacter phenylpyruvicus]|uniref:replication initiation protein RepM n=2 Tax=Psychrobacter phenylpyruvicus TaxID=29432 RepID=UPI00191B9AE0|nr:replication initiation protein RepM [Psychrobacter phenylpyruvicus]
MNELVVKDNALINASYSLSLVEQRLILLAIVITREHHHNMQWDFMLGKPIEISASDYVEAFGVTRQTAYEALQEACKTLFNRQFSYQEREVKGIWKKTSRWVSDIAYMNETATVSFTFAPAVLPLIIQLEKHLTSYELQQVANLSSAYAVRLYEVLIAWRSVGKTPLIKVDDLKEMLGIKSSEYTRMSNFKSRVLDYSLGQINEHTDIKASYEQHKQGRVITGFTFKFKMKSKPKKSLDGERDPNTGDMFTIDGLTDKQLARIARSEQFKADYNHLISPTSPINNDYTGQAWVAHFVNELKKDASRFNKRPIKAYLDY